MSEEKEVLPEHVVDKSKWARGPWDQEPDHLAWKTKAGLPAIIHRVESHGALCGYVAVPPGHPLHGKSYDTPRYEKDTNGDTNYDKPLPGHSVEDLNVHGGVTYGSNCAGHICHVPEPGEPDDVHWIGFDTSHSGDLSPAHEAFVRERGAPSYDYASHNKYRTVEYVKAECESLAEQIVALTK